MKSLVLFIPLKLRSRYGRCFSSPSSLSSSLLANDAVPTVVNHGVFGAQFDILEEDMIEVLKGRLQKLKDSGELSRIEADIKKKSLEKLAEPTPVSGLKSTEVERQFTHDPTLVIEADIKDHEGQVLAKKGIASIL